MNIYKHSFGPYSLFAENKTNGRMGTKKGVLDSLEAQHLEAESREAVVHFVHCVPDSFNSFKVSRS